MANLSSFAFLGVKDFVISDKMTGEVACNLKHLVSLNLEDTMSEDFLRGGYGNSKLLTVYGDRSTVLTGSTATQTTALMKIMSNSTTETKTKELQQVEEPTLSGGKFSLKLMPVSGAAITVCALDSFGKELKLTAGSPTNPKEYSIVGKDITANSSVKAIRVYYIAQQEAECIEVKDITPKTWSGTGLLIAKEVETGKLFKALLECPNMSITPNFSMSAANDGQVPAAVELTINLMMDNGKGYPYSISFVEE